jgi:hypothetical protein
MAPMAPSSAMHGRYVRSRPILPAHAATQLIIAGVMPDQTLEQEARPATAAECEISRDHAGEFRSPASPRQ